MFTVADLADAGTAEMVKFPHLTGRQPDQNMGPFLSHQLGGGPGTAHQLAAFADLHLDVVDNGSQRNVCHRQTVARLDIDVFTGDNLVTDRNPVRSQYIFLVTVEITEQGNICRPVGVVFDGYDLGSDVRLVALEIDNPVFALVTAAVWACKRV